MIHSDASVIHTPHADRRVSHSQRPTQAGVMSDGVTSSDMPIEPADASTTCHQRRGMNTPCPCCNTTHIHAGYLGSFDARRVEFEYVWVICEVLQPTLLFWLSQYIRPVRFVHHAGSAARVTA